VVITREKVHESPVEHGSNYGHWHYETWRFVVEIRPQGAPAYRAGVERKIRTPDTVRVEYEAKHPDRVELALEGDDRYDDGLANREEKARDKAGKAGRDASFQAALDAPPWTPPQSAPPGADGEGSQSS